MSPPPGPGGQDAEPPAPLDLRLVPVLGTAWAGAGALVVAPPGLVAAAALAAGALSALALVLAAHLLRPAPAPTGRAGSLRTPAAARRASPRRRGAAVAASTAGAAAVLATVAVSVLATVAITGGPLVDLAAQGASARVTMVVTGSPHRAAPPEGPQGRSLPERWVLRARAVAVTGGTGSAGATGLRTPVVVLAGPSWSGLQRGARVQVLGSLEAAGPGDAARALLTTRAPPRVLSPPRGWAGVVLGLRAGLASACAPLGDDAGGLLPGLVVGDTSAVPPDLSEAMRTTGLTHLTAVSGANVALVVAAATALAAAAGLMRRARVVLAAAVLLAFAGVAGPDPSVLRAALTGVVGLAGVLSARRGAGLPALGAAGTVLLVADPWLSRSFGFALSVLATGGLLVLGRPWAAALARVAPRWLAIALAAPLAAQAVCGPVVLLLSDGLPVLAVPANLAAAPVVGPTTIAGLGATLLAPLWPAGAVVLARAGGIGTWWIATVARTGAALPVATAPWPGGTVGALALAAATVAAVAALTLLAGPGLPGRRSGPGTGSLRAGRRRGLAR